MVMWQQLVPDGENAAIAFGIDGTVVDDGGKNDSSILPVSVSLTLTVPYPPQQSLCHRIGHVP